MELTVKNDYLEDLIGAVIQEDKPVFEGKTTQRLGEELVIQYAMDLIYSGARVGVSLDLTYATVKELPVALKCRYQECRKEFSAADSAGSLAKSLAAYLFALAMNLHDCRLKVTQVVSPLSTPTENREPMWGVFRISAGFKKECDLLLPVDRGIRFLGQPGRQMLTIDVSQLVQAYQDSFGIDLCEHGLTNIAFEA